MRKIRESVKECGKLQKNADHIPPDMFANFFKKNKARSQQWAGARSEVRKQIKVLEIPLVKMEAPHLRNAAVIIPPRCI